MTVGLRLDLRQSQRLAMTPQLQQAIKLLQMSNRQLAEFVDDEVERNPLLRLDGADDEGGAIQARADDRLTATDRRLHDHGLAAETFDAGFENLYDGARPTAPGHAGGTWFPSPGNGSSARARYLAELPPLEDRLAERPSLRTHLRAQLGQMRGHGADLAVALHIVEELDEHGFLRTDLGDLAERLGTDADTAMAGLILLQGCEPTGVGARDLPECLRLQAHELGLLDAPLAALLDNLDLVARGELRRLRTLCAISEADLGDMLRTLRRLDPRPCAAFDVEDPETLPPDVLLERAEGGGWRVEMNADTLPRVLIDQSYAAEIGRDGSIETRHFLAECRSNAGWLMKSLDQRARTIVKVTSEIVRRQKGFFAHGIRGLRPLTLRAVADEVGLHESTVSRVTANKYLATERGTFELKFFFTNALADGEDGVAAEAVRHRLKAMIDAEPACAILSDDAIADKLVEDGIEIARRTVAKYRKSLNIPSSVERRRMKALSGSS